jgi:hypothetical protein
VGPAAVRGGRAHHAKTDREAPDFCYAFPAFIQANARRRASGFDGIVVRVGKLIDEQPPTWIFMTEHTHAYECVPTNAYDLATLQKWSHAGL